MCRLSENPCDINLLEPSGPVQACNGIALNTLAMNRSRNIVDIMVEAFNLKLRVSEIRWGLLRRYTATLLHVFVMFLFTIWK
jgi:hypothetical protein